MAQGAIDLGVYLARAVERQGLLDARSAPAPREPQLEDLSFLSGHGLQEFVDPSEGLPGPGLEQLAIGELQARHDRVSAYLAQARFALAASYDRATLAEVGQ